MWIESIQAGQLWESQRAEGKLTACVLRLAVDSLEVTELGLNELNLCQEAAQGHISKVARILAAGC